MSRYSIQRRPPQTPPAAVLSQRDYPYHAVRRAEADAEALRRRDVRALEEAGRDPKQHLRVERAGELREIATREKLEARDDPTRARFDSFMLYAEVRVKQALSATRSAGREQRNLPLTATCCEILLRLGRAFPQCSTLVNLLARETVRGIYLDFDDQTFTAEAERWSRSHAPLRDMVNIKTGTPEQTSFLHSWTPFFAVIEAQTAALKVAETRVKAFRGVGLTLGQLSEKRQRLMLNAVRNWQVMLLRRCFDNWRRASQMRQRQLWCLRRRRTKIYFSAWRRNILHIRCENLQHANMELQEEIELLEENTLELRDQRDALNADKNELEKNLEDAKNFKLRQSDTETALRDELQQVKRERDLLRKILERQRKQDSEEIDVFLGNQSSGTRTVAPAPWEMAQHIHDMYTQESMQDEEGVSSGSPSGGGATHPLRQRETWLKSAERRLKEDKPQDIVMRWVNHHLAARRGRTHKNGIDNFSAHFRDGEKIAALISATTGETDRETEAEKQKQKEGSGIDYEGEQQNVEQHTATPAIGVEAADTPESAEFEDGHSKEEEVAHPQTFHELVLNELDPSKRATMCVEAGRVLLGVPDAVLEASDILTGDADANFAFLSYLFIMRPSLGSPGELQMHWHERWEAVKRLAPPSVDTTTPEALHASVRPFEDTRKIREELEKVARFDAQSHSLFWEASKKVFRMLIGELSARTRGSTGTMSALEESKEVTAYSSIPVRKIADLLDIEDECKADANAKAERAAREAQQPVYLAAVAAVTAAAAPAPTEQTAQPTEKMKIALAEIRYLEQYLGSQYRDIKKIFRAYGALGGGAASTISRGEFAALMKDIQIYDKSFHAAEADIIFLRSNWELDPNTGELRAAADRSLTCTEFVEALVRVAQARFQSSQTTTLKGCVEALFNRCLLPFAQRSDVDRFRKLLGQKRVQEVFAKYENKLKMVFLTTAGNDDTIQLDEFTRFLKGKGIVNKTFPAKSILKIFNNVQDDSDPLEISEGGEEEDECPEDAMMTYSEFLEALAAIASYVLPDPYVCLEQRLEVFFLTRVVDHISPKMLRAHMARQKKAAGSPKKNSL